MLYRKMFGYLCGCDGADSMSMSQCLNNSRKKKNQDKNTNIQTMQLKPITKLIERWKQKMCLFLFMRLKKYEIAILFPWGAQYYYRKKKS